MEQIEQLKAMRDAARARIEAMPDHRLMTSLSALIEDLESAFGGRQSPSAAARQEEQGANSGAAAQPGPQSIVAGEADAAEAQSAFQEPASETSQPEQVEETVVIVETTPEADDEVIDMLIAPEEIENLIAAEVVSMNGEANGAAAIAETEEEAVSRALDELSIDLADSLGSQPAGYTRR
jgi:hypothetical protein